MMFQNPRGAADSADSKQYEQLLKCCQMVFTLLFQLLKNILSRNITLGFVLDLTEVNISLIIDF